MPATHRRSELAPPEISVQLILSLWERRVGLVNWTGKGKQAKDCGMRENHDHGDNDAGKPLLPLKAHVCFVCSFRQNFTGLLPQRYCPSLMQEWWIDRCNRRSRRFTSRMYPVPKDLRGPWILGAHPHLVESKSSGCHCLRCLFFCYHFSRVYRLSSLLLRTQWARDKASSLNKFHRTGNRAMELTSLAVLLLAGR